VRIRRATSEDAAAIAAIYEPYVRDTAITFETEPPGPAEIAARMAAGEGLYPWLVADREEGGVAGYVYAAAFRSRAAYRFAVETTVYLASDAQGRGVGTALYRPLLDLLERQGFTQAVAAIALPNEASVRLHERLGFRRTGTYERVGWKLGSWIDVGLWQRPLAAAEVPPRELRHPPPL
jgi:phosphinothricin acetyltransferase